MLRTTAPPSQNKYAACRKATRVSTPEPTPASGRSSWSSSATAGSRTNASRSRGLLPPPASSARTRGGAPRGPGSRYRARTDGGAPRGASALAGQDRVEQPRELVGRFDVGHVSAVGNPLTRHDEQLRQRVGRLEGNGIGLAVQHDRRHAEFRDRGTQVELAEAIPHFLLGAAGDPERRELGRAAPVVEVARDGELEEATAIGLRIALPHATLQQLPARRLDLRGAVSRGEAALEIGPGAAPDRRAGHQGKTLDRGGVLDGVKQRE